MSVDVDALKYTDLSQIHGSHLVSNLNCLINRFAQHQCAHKATSERITSAVCIHNLVVGHFTHGVNLWQIWFSRRDHCSRICPTRDDHDTWA